MSRHNGPWKIRAASPSKGRKRRSHAGHKPVNVLSRDPRASKVVRMFGALQERGWTFSFKVEARSPYGFLYQGEGASPLEAFLKAFKLWRSEVARLVPKIPATIENHQRQEALKAKRKKTRIKELLLAAGPDIARLSHLGPRVAPSPDPQVNQTRIYNRLYMRAYRASRRPLRLGRPRALALAV